MREAASFELLSLDPTAPVDADAGDRFHDWAVLGRGTVDSPVVRRTLIDALEAGVAGNGGGVAACFEPRHAISVLHRNRRHDFVICFACLSAKRFVDGAERPGFLTTASPQPAFDDALKSLNLPLAPAPDK